MLDWGCDRCGREEKTDEPEDERRARRGCDAPLPSIDWEWLPFPLNRCPWSAICETPETFVHLEWWEDWEVFGLLPGGSASIADEDHIVYSVLRECARIKADVMATENARIKREIENAKRRSARAGRG